MGSVRGFSLPFLFFLVWLLLSLLAKSVSVDRTTYIVHMDKSLMPKAFTSSHNCYYSIINSFKSEKLTLLDGRLSSSSIIYTYSHALHGFSAFLSLDELEALKKSPGFISAYKDKTVTLDTTHTPEFLSPNPSISLWPISKFGKCVIIGVVDSGVWPVSESFKDIGITVQVPTRWKGMCEVGQNLNSSLCNSKLIGVR